MQTQSSLALFTLTGVVLVAQAPVATLAQAPSVCVAVQDGCHVPGAIVTATVELSESGFAIVSSRLSIQYDPQVLDLVSIEPGNVCDATSPFVLMPSQTVDALGGEANVGVSVELGAPGTNSMATLACLRFVVIDNSTSSVCLFDGPVGLSVVDEEGQTVPVDNSVACPSEAPYPTISCDEFVGDNTCQCVTGPPDCSFWDDDCSVGLCNELAGRCEAVPVNEGGLCDDGNPCTTADTCNNGVCVGAGCTNPSLCVVTEEVCRAVGETTVRIELGQGVPVITGGQFSLRYDASALDFLSISPGYACDPTSPFELEIFETVDELTGEVFYATAVNPFFFAVDAPPGEVQSGTQGPTTMACVRFAVREPGTDATCVFDGETRTTLIDETGQPVIPFSQADCPADAGTPAISCGDITVTEDCACVPGLGDCSGLDTGCRTGFCDEESNLCVTIPTREGEACDDGDRCTHGETCVDGDCVGTVDGIPSLCIVTEGLEFDDDFVVEVSIQLGESATEIVGGQFSIRYDPAALDFIGAAPGASCDAGSPFVSSVFLESQNAENGEIFYGVGAALGGVGSYGPTTLACLRFRVTGLSAEGICVLEGLNPMTTVLVSASGQSVCIYNTDDCPTVHARPVLSCDDIPLTIPAVGGWGVLVLTLLLLTGAKIRFDKRTHIASRST